MTFLVNILFICKNVASIYPCSKPKEKKTKRVQNERDKIVTKTFIHEKNQVCNIEGSDGKTLITKTEWALNAFARSTPNLRSKYLAHR